MRVFGGMGRGEEKVLGVSKCTVHCKVKSMDESSGHTEPLHDMDVPFTGAASLQAELIAEVSCTVRTST